jgi:hypothetical protein
MMNERLQAGEAKRVEPSWLRTFGPAALAYLIATALTSAHFWGDSVDYAAGVVTGWDFWDFGHLLWRPLGWLLTRLVPAGLLGASDESGRALVVLLADGSG